jgi:phosphoribosylanthranilate isomerase
MKIPRIKVCGVTQEADLRWLADSGVDTIGINLVSTSKRYVSLSRGIELARVARELNLQTVAVVMNPAVEELHRVCTQYPWDFVQLHGQELPMLANHCCGVSIIKAVAWNGMDEQQQLVQAWRQDSDQERFVAGSTSRLAAFLLDAYAPGQGGGSGMVARWDLVQPRPAVLQDWPLILAGGLTPQNICQAIAATRVDGVDVASGIEESPGRKSRHLTEQFVVEAQRGFAS